MKKNILRNLLDEAFKLPPIEQRIDINRSFINRLTNVDGALKEKDDTYIYYLAARSTAILGCIIGAFILLIYNNEAGLDFWKRYAYFTPDPQKHMLSFLKLFNQMLGKATLFIILPFYLLKFRWNINPKNYDLLWFNKNFIENNGYKKRRLVVIPLMLFLLVVMLLAMTFVHLIPYGIFLNWYRTETVFSLLFYMLIIIWIISYGCSTVLQTLVTLWRFIGPYADPLPRKA